MQHKTYQILLENPRQTITSHSTTLHLIAARAPIPWNFWKTRFYNKQWYGQGVSKTLMFEIVVSEK